MTCHEEYVVQQSFKVASPEYHRKLGDLLSLTRELFTNVFFFITWSLQIGVLRRLFQACTAAYRWLCHKIIVLGMLIIGVMLSRIVSPALGNV